MLIEQKSSITIGDVNILVDYGSKYVALSNPVAKKVMIFTPENFNQAFTRLLIENGIDYEPGGKKEG